MRPELPGLRRTSINVLATWVLQAATVLFALVTVPLITRRFGMEGLGLWLLIQQLASHLQLLELGLASSLGRFLSRDRARADATAYTGHASSALALLMVMGSCLVLSAIPLGWAFPRLFTLPQHLVTEATWMLVVAIVVTGLSLPLRSAIGVFSSQHRFDLQSIIEGLSLIARVALVALVCAVVIDYALVALSLAVFIPVLLGVVVLFIVARRISPYPLFNPGSVGRKYLRDILEVSLSAMFITISAVMLRQGSPMLAGHALGVQAVPLVALPIMLVTSLGPFLGIASQLIAPVASQLDACQQTKELREVYLVAARYTVTIGLLIFAGIALLAPVLLPHWLGRGVLGGAEVRTIHISLLLVFAGYCLALPAFLARTVLVSVGKHRVAASGEMVSVLTGLGIGWLLMQVFGWGAVGMASGVALAYLIRAGGVMIRQLAQYFGTSVRHLYAAVWRRPLVTALPLSLAFVPGLWGHHILAVSVAFALSACGLWGWLTWKWIVPVGHRQRMRQRFGCLATQSKHERDY
jgi:O-antigen/teichoic acid export membrane protein